MTAAQDFAFEDGVITAFTPDGKAVANTNGITVVENSKLIFTSIPMTIFVGDYSSAK